MLFDVEAALAEHAKRQHVSQRLMFDFATERMLLAAVLCGDVLDAPWDALGLCHDLELDDFADYRCRAAFRALRNLQADGKVFGLWEVFVELEGEGRTDAVTLEWLVDLVMTEPRVSVDWIVCAQKRLRNLAQHRRLA